MDKFRKNQNKIFFGGLAIIVIVFLIMSNVGHCSDVVDFPYTISSGNTNIDIQSIFDNYSSQLPFDYTDNCFAVGYGVDTWIDYTTFGSTLAIALYHTDGNFPISNFVNTITSDGINCRFDVSSLNETVQTAYFEYNYITNLWVYKGSAGDTLCIIDYYGQYPLTIGEYTLLPRYPLYTSGDIFADIDTGSGMSNNFWLFTSSGHSQGGFPNLEDWSGISSDNDDFNGTGFENSPINPSNHFENPDTTTDNGMLQRIDNDINKQSNLIGKGFSTLFGWLVDNENKHDEQQQETSNKLDIIIQKLQDIYDKIPIGGSGSPGSFLFDKDQLLEDMEDSLSGQLILLPVKLISEVVNGVVNGQAPDRFVIEFTLPDYLFGGGTYEFNADWYPPVRETVSNIVIIFLSMGLYFRFIATLPDIIKGATSAYDSENQKE